MKTKTLFSLVAVVAVVGFATSAQAGWSVNLSFAAPIQYEPVYSPPAVYCPPPVVYYPAPVAYCPPPVVYVAPRYDRHYDYHDYHCHDGDRHGWGGHDRHDDRGHDHGGHR